MVGRLSVIPIIRGHWKGLSRDVGGRTVPDYWARVVLAGPTIVVLVWGLVAGWTVTAPVPLLTGVTLLSGGILGVFAQLSALRLKLTERAQESWLDVERDGIDEAVAHLLVALLLCVFSAAAIIVGLNVSPVIETAGQTVLAAPWAALVLAAASYLGLLFLIIIPKLYSAYVEMNKVRPELSGFHRPLSRTRSRLRR